MCGSRRTLKSSSAQICGVNKSKKLAEKKIPEVRKLKYFGPSVEYPVTTISSDPKENCYSLLKPLLECTLNIRETECQTL